MTGPNEVEAGAGKRFLTIRIKLRSYLRLRAGD